MDRHGVYGVLGRQLYYKEIIRMNVFNNIVSAYKSRLASGDFGAWAKSEPELADILARAEIMANK